jgi:DNA-binding FadR family transcriptional regulator
MRMGLHAIAASEQRMDSVLAEHQAIAQGVRSGDADQAADPMAQHLTKTLAVLCLPRLNITGPRSFERAV